jgi:hypothetical protein
VLPIAEREGATPFDIPDAELGHHGDECSFDAIVHKYGLADKDPALARLALIVRGANTPAARPDGPSHAAWLRSLRASTKRVPTTTSSSPRSCPCTTRSMPGAASRRMAADDAYALRTRPPVRSCARPAR